MKSIVFMALTVKINHATELIKRWQKHSFIFFGWVLQRCKKMKVCFVRLP